MELTPVEMAKILRAEHTLKIEDKEIASVLLNHILVSLQEYSHLLSNEDFYEVYFSLHKTRQGSREMYRTLDYIMSLRLPEIIKDTQLTRKLYAVAGTSGLTDPELLRHLAASC